MTENTLVKIINYRTNDVRNITKKDIKEDDTFQALLDDNYSVATVFIHGQEFKIQKHWLKRLNKNKEWLPISINPAIDSSAME